jgi:hypothetical protein
MKNSIKLITLALLLSASSAYLLGMEQNTGRPSLPQPDFSRMRTNPDEEPADPETIVLPAPVCPLQEPIHAAAKHAGAAFKSAVLHAYWAANGGPTAALNLFPAQNDHNTDQ